MKYTLSCIVDENKLAEVVQLLQSKGATSVHVNPQDVAVIRVPNDLPGFDRAPSAAAPITTKNKMAAPITLKGLPKAIYDVLLRNDSAEGMTVDQIFYRVRNQGYAKSSVSTMCSRMTVAGTLRRVKMGTYDTLPLK